MNKPASGVRPSDSATGGTFVVALFGAAATVVLLTGVVAIAASPRSLSDDTRLPVSAESFEVTPFEFPDFELEAFAVATARGYSGVLSLQVNDENRG